MDDYINDDLMITDRHSECFASPDLRFTILNKIRDGALGQASTARMQYAKENKKNYDLLCLPRCPALLLDALFRLKLRWLESPSNEKDWPR
jgi:hypothetical protein